MKALLLIFSLVALLNCGAKQQSATQEVTTSQPEIATQPELGVVIYFEKVPTNTTEANQYRKTVMDVAKSDFESKYGAYEMKKWITTAEYNSPEFKSNSEECDGGPCPCKPNCICGAPGTSTANQCW